MSRVPHEPTQHSRELVRLHTTVGTTQAHIAQILGIDLKTLRKWYRHDLDLSKARANATIGGALFNNGEGRRYGGDDILDEDAGGMAGEGARRRPRRVAADDSYQHA